MRWGNALNAIVVGWRASVVRGEEPGCFRDIAGVSIVVAGSPHSMSRQLSGLKNVSPTCLLSLSKCTVQGAVPR